MAPVHRTPVLENDAAGTARSASTLCQQVPPGSALLRLAIPPSPSASQFKRLQFLFKVKSVDLFVFIVQCKVPGSSAIC